MQDALRKADSGKVYPVAEAVALARRTDTARFDATVEAACRSNVGPRKADRQIHGAVVSPNGTDKTQAVLVSAKEDKAEEAEAAGVDSVGDDGMVQKIRSGWFDFDIVVVAPDMMATTDRLGRILGPKGLMSNPKTGTITVDVTKAISEVKTGRVTYHVDKAGNIHVPIGRVPLDGERLVENSATTYDVLLKAEPSAAKGQYMKNVTIITIFGPGIHVDQASL